MTYTVCVLKSTLNGIRYVGFTGKDVNVRLREHNSGHNIFTAKSKPFVLAYYEKGYCKSCAVVREAFLKSGQGRKILDSIDSHGT